MRFEIKRERDMIRVNTGKGHFNIAVWEGHPKDFGISHILPDTQRIKLYEIQEFMPYGTMHDDEIKERTGLGKASLDLAERIAKEDGAHAIAVTTDNPRLVELLAKSGFQKVKHRVYIKLLKASSGV